MIAQAERDTLEIYGRHAQHAWSFERNTERNRFSECCDQDAKAMLGLMLYRMLNRCREKWMDAVLDKRIEYRLSDAQELADAFKVWMTCTETVLAEDHAAGNSSVYTRRLARFYLGLQKQDLEPAETMKRINELNEGKGLSIDEFFDAVRR